MRLVEKQFRESSRLLSVYKPSYEEDFKVPIVLLRSSEGFAPPGLNDVPNWLQHRENEDVVVSDWEAFMQSTLKTWSIPGDHFGPFHPENVRKSICWKAKSTDSQLSRLIEHLSSSWMHVIMWKIFRSLSF
jgi:hypothetical protein